MRYSTSNGMPRATSASSAARTAPTSSGCTPASQASRPPTDSSSAVYPTILAALGLMKKNCIKLVPVPIGSAAISLAQTVAGRQDLALINPTGIVSAVAQGQKLKIIAPNTTEQESAPGTGNSMFIKNNGPIKINDLIRELHARHD